MLVTLVARIGHQVPWSYIEIYIYGVARCLMWVLETELEQQVLLTTKPRALVFIYVSVLSYPRIIVTGF